MINAPIKIIIADDILPIREYLSMVLSHENNLQVIKLVGSGREAVECCRLLEPDLVLMDIEMETPYAGIEAIQKIRRLSKKINCVVLVDYRDDEIVEVAFRAGASNYILKDAAKTEMLKVVQTVFSRSNFRYNQAI